MDLMILQKPKDPDPLKIWRNPTKIQRALLPINKISEKINSCFKHGLPLG
jgi:hypothetical protein